MRTVPLDIIPPFLCRAYAHVVLSRRRTRPKLVAEIARESGLSARSVKRLSRRTTWRQIRVGVAFSFANACGVDLMDPDPIIDRMRGGRDRAHWKHNRSFYSKLFAEARRELELKA